MTDPHFRSQKYFQVVCHLKNIIRGSALGEGRICPLPVAPGTAAVALFIDAQRSPAVAMSRTLPDSTFPEDGFPSFKERSLSKSNEVEFMSSEIKETGGDIRYQ